jgi:hypothetical protein
MQRISARHLSLYVVLEQFHMHFVLRASLHTWYEYALKDSSSMDDFIYLLR